MRYVPAPPDLVADVREYVQAHELKPNDLLLTGTRNGDALAAVVVRRAWAAARLEVLGEEVTGKDGKPTRVVLTVTGKKIYDLRHTCLTRWLNKKIPPAQVAEWAGNSVPVLLAPTPSASTDRRRFTGNYSKRMPPIPRARPGSNLTLRLRTGRAGPGKLRRVLAAAPAETPVKSETTGMRRM